MQPSFLHVWLIVPVHELIKEGLAGSDLPEMNCVLF